MTGKDYNFELIAALRRDAERTQEELAVALGVSARQYQRAEHGGTISFNLLSRLARHHKRPVTDFLIAPKKKTGNGVK